MVFLAIFCYSLSLDASRLSPTVVSVHPYWCSSCLSLFIHLVSVDHIHLNSFIVVSVVGVGARMFVPVINGCRCRLWLYQCWSSWLSQWLSSLAVCRLRLFVVFGCLSPLAVSRLWLFVVWLSVKTGSRWKTWCGRMRFPNSLRRPWNWSGKICKTRKSP